jgi:predicted nucleotidyltransferase
LREDSDLDFVIEFDASRGNMHDFIGVIDFLERIFQRKVGNLKFENFIKDHKTIDAVIRNIEDIRRSNKKFSSNIKIILKF